MSRYYNDNFLIHYGVPGMKWGVRKDQYDPHFTSYRTERKTYRRMGEAFKNNQGSDTYKRYVAQKKNYDKLSSKLSDKYDNLMNNLLDKYDDGTRDYDEVDRLINSDKRMISIRKSLEEGENALEQARESYMKESLDSYDYQKYSDLGRAALWDVENGRFNDELRSYRYAR